jgi:hypothetical protein
LAGCIIEIDTQLRLAEGEVVMNQSDNRQQELLGLVAKIGIVAIAGATIYLLGRLYLEAYYRYFGIAPGALVFSTEDYMFSCLNIVLMVVGIAFWIWFASKDVSSEKLFLNSTSNRWQDGLKDILKGILFMFVPIAVIFAMMEGGLSGWMVAKAKGLLGLVAGFGIGMSFFYFCDLIEYMCRYYKVKWSMRNLFTPYQFVFLAVFVFALLPSLSSSLARWAAFVEFQDFPQVTVISSDALPLEMQTSEEVGDNHRVTGKLLIVNNDMAYVFKSDGNEPSKAAVEFPKSGKVYAIRFSDIQYMIQYPVDSSDNSTGEIGK